ncbi:tetratricopeptide repeat protein [Nannocystis pusilla]|uniref:tetratricopeptide repeat protein n=1 Tax=Nannocystis pusilla TaxID=889268 RepID=UPI003B7CE736
MSLGLGLTICLSGQPTIASPAAPPSEARAAFEAGAKAYAAGDFDKALAQFERAMALRPSPKIHYNIGVCRQQLMLAARERGDVEAESLHAAAAVEAYKAYLRELPEAEDRVEVEATIRDLGGTPHFSSKRFHSRAPTGHLSDAKMRRRHPHLSLRRRPCLSPIRHPWPRRRRVRTRPTRRRRSRDRPR